MKNSIAFVLLAFALSLAGPVSYYGNLYVDGNRIKGKNGEVVQLKGPSFFWSDGNLIGFYVSRNVNWFVDTMDVSVIRHAMIVRYMNQYGQASNEGGGDGYLINETNKAKQINLIDTMVQAAIRNDIYIIIDWHSHRAQNEQSAAVEFFRDMATKYKDVPNVIYEIYNEPPGGNCNDWNSYSAYMNAVIGAIRNTAQNNNLILVGSPMWSSCPHVGNYHTTYSNIAYTIHFYAATHNSGGDHRNNSNTALSGNRAVFASEWGTTQSSGDSHVDAASSRNWMQWMNTNKVSSCQWSVSNLEGSSIFKPNTSVSLSNLSQSGDLLYEFMGGNKNSNTLGKNPPPSGWPWARSRSIKGLKEGEVKTWTKQDMELSTGAVFHDGNTPGLSVTNDQITFTVPRQLTSTTYNFNYYIKQGSNISMHRITLTDIARELQATVDRLNVAQRSPTSITLPMLGISYPGGALTDISITGERVSAGTVAWNNTTRRLVYTPPSNSTLNQEVTLTYTIVAKSGLTLEKEVTLVLGGSTPIQNSPLSANFGLSSRGSGISVSLAKSGAASLNIYSITGAKVAALMSGHQNAGSYEFSLNNFAKGVYIVHLRQGSELKTLKIVR